MWLEHGRWEWFHKHWLSLTCKYSTPSQLQPFACHLVGKVAIQASVNLGPCDAYNTRDGMRFTISTKCSLDSSLSINSFFMPPQTWDLEDPCKKWTWLHVPLKEAIQGGWTPEKSVFWNSTYETAGRNSCFSRQTALSICRGNNFLSNVILCLESQLKSWCASAKHSNRKFMKGASPHSCVPGSSFLLSNWKSFPRNVRVGCETKKTRKKN